MNYCKMLIKLFAFQVFVKLQLAHDICQQSLLFHTIISGQWNIVVWEVNESGFRISSYYCREGMIIKSLLYYDLNPKLVGAYILVKNIVQIFWSHLWIVKVFEVTATAIYTAIAAKPSKFTANVVSHLLFFSLWLKDLAQCCTIVLLSHLQSREL